MGGIPPIWNRGARLATVRQSRRHSECLLSRFVGGMTVVIVHSPVFGGVKAKDFETVGVRVCPTGRRLSAVTFLRLMVGADKFPHLRYLGKNTDR
jgi:hypothetical protein